MQAVIAKPNIVDYDQKVSVNSDAPELNNSVNEIDIDQASSNRDEVLELSREKLEKDVNLDDFTGELEENIDEEIPKNIFHHLSEFIKPVTDLWANQPLMAPVISGLGAALHLVDGFAEMKGLPESTLKFTRAASIGYSKFITSMPNILDGIHRLKNNDYVEGLSRLFLYRR